MTNEEALPKGRGPATRIPTDELARAARFESMLQNAPTNVMFADRDFVIQYMNPASLETLRTLEEYLPVPADQVVGSSLDIFHKNPSYQRGILASESNLPRQANINVGPETLDLLVSPIRDKDGNYIGAMATWEVITEKLRNEKLAQEAAADSAAVNEVLQALQGASSADEAARLALDTVRASFGWAYGSYWKVDDSDRKLKFVLESGDAGEEFRRVTLTASFAEGVGLSGRAWRSRDLYFTRDIGEMTDCCRAPVARRIGVKSGVWFPLIVGGEVVGAMDFFATETLDPSPGRLDALRNVGRMVSQAIGKVVAQEREREAAEALRRNVDLILDMVNAAAGDLTREVTGKGDDAIGQMGESLDKFFSDLRRPVGAIAQNATTVSSASEQLTGVSEQMGANAAETSAQATW